MKPSIKLWLSGQDAERHRDWHASRNILFYKGTAVALRYYSSLTERNHIIFKEDMRIPVERVGFPVPCVMDFISDDKINQKHIRLSDQTLDNRGIYPSNFWAGLIVRQKNVDRFFDREYYLEHKISLGLSSGHRYLIVRETALPENGGFNAKLLSKKESLYMPSWQTRGDNLYVYGMNDEVDFTLAVVEGSLFHVDLVLAKQEYLSALEQRLAPQRKLSSQPLVA